MVDGKSIANSVADSLNGIARAMRGIPMPKSTPEFDRWQREMREASKHILAAFGIDPEQVKSPAIPCGGNWFVEWKGGTEDGEWVVVERS